MQTAMEPPALEAVKLTKAYGEAKKGEVKALDGISFTVQKGEVFGLLGPNGAGKSTCIKIFVNLLRPTSGTARLFGIDVVGDSLKTRALMGYLPEMPALFEHLTGREFLAMNGAIRGLNPELLEERVEAFSQILDLGHQMDSLIGTYSKGMRQKVAFASSVLHDPPMLILDEPTSGLDPRFARYIKDIIAQKARAGGTILLSTHITDVAEELCDRIAIINKGNIADIGTLKDVKERAGRNTLEEVFIHHVGGRKWDGSLFTHKLL